VPVVPVVDLDHVTKVYTTAAGDTTALNDVSFTVAPGEFVSIMGPSGSGKSTLMNIIGLLDRPTHGVYRLNGHDVDDYDERGLAALRSHEIGFVFQSFNLLPRTSVLKNVILPMEYTGVARAQRRHRAEAALAQVGLPPDLFHHLSNEISGGQMQRVAIARALVNHPSLLLADEPTGNLDTKTGEAVLSMFSELHHEGATIVLITHDLQVARHADRILHIRDGELHEGEFGSDRAPADRASVNRDTDGNSASGGDAA
jgi:putative ABC transport system ATP-binding protein